MRWTSRVIIGLRSIFRRQRVEHELDAELQFHLHQQVEENAAGMSLDEARRSASRSLGGVTLIRADRCHGVHRCCGAPRERNVYSHLRRKLISG